MELYHPLVPGVAARDMRVTTGNNKQVLVTSVLLLGRYAEPTENDVVQHLQEVAGRVASIKSNLIPGGEIIALSPLECALLQLSLGTLAELRSGNGTATTVIRQHTQAPDISERRSYVEIRSGVLPWELGDYAAQKNREKAWYEQTLEIPLLRERGFGRSWTMDIAHEGGTLSPYRRIHFLLSEEALVSRSLRIRGGCFSLDEFEAAVETVYLHYTDVLQLEDRSAAILESYALKPVQMLRKNESPAIHLPSSGFRVYFSQPKTTSNN